MEGLWIEMIGQVISTDRKAQREFGIHLEVLGDPGIHGKEIRESVLIGHANVILGNVGYGVRESTSIFKDGCDSEAVWKWY